MPPGLSLALSQLPSALAVPGSELSDRLAGSWCWRVSPISSRPCGMSRPCSEPSWCPDLRSDAL